MLNQNKTADTDILYVQMFSHFTAGGMGGKLEEEDIRSEMLTRLWVYILCHRNRSLTILELTDALWQPEEVDNPAGALKNLMYRLRSALKKEWSGIDFIQTGRGTYRWNEAVPVRMDAEEFEECCKRAERTESADQKIECYKQALDLYKGMFLPKHMEIHWITALSTYYHSMYLTAVKAVSALLLQAERHAEVSVICKKAIQLDALDETIQCSFIRALIGEKKLKLAQEQYEKAVDSLYENLGVSPTAELREVYEELLKQTNEEKTHISAVKEELEDDDLSGAFLCEYGIFKRTYQLEKRRSNRIGRPVFLSLITVVPKGQVDKGSPQYLNMINKEMNNLKEVLVSSLRSGDVLSRYSGNQFIVMLPGCQYEPAQMVMKRIQDAFAAKNPRSAVQLKMSLGEMEPK